MANEEFEIGDKVVCLEVPKDCGGTPLFTTCMKKCLGQVGEVIGHAKYTKSFEVRFPSIGVTYYFKPHWIVHHKEPGEEEFKIGDKVYCREVPANVLEGPTFQPVMINYLGEVGEIVGSRSKTTGAFKVRFPSTGKCFFFMPKWLTKLYIPRGYVPLTKPDSPLLTGEWICETRTGRTPAPETPPKWRFGRFRYAEPSRMVDVVFEGKIIK